MASGRERSNFIAAPALLSVKIIPFQKDLSEEWPENDWSSIPLTIIPLTLSVFPSAIIALITGLRAAPLRLRVFAFQARRKLRTTCTVERALLSV